MNPIEVVNLSKKFKNKVVLDNLNLTVKDRELFGFLGRNGAGKSTFINILTGTINKTDGIFKILNYDEKNINKAKKEFGVMPDVSNLYSNMTAMEFLSYMSNLKNIKYNKFDLRNLMNLVGLEVLDNIKIKNYSFGMKKKISLAQSLIGEPRLLFLDEPTSGVDPESILYIQKLILDLNKKGTTIFLTSHNLNEIEKMCTSIAILKDGNISLCGTLDDIRTSYNKNISVTIKSSMSLNINRLGDFVNSRLIEIQENYYTFKVKNENDIAQIIFEMAKNNIYIYSVIQNKTTLEEIFLD